MFIYCPSLLKTKRAEFLAIFGRRRVDKTFSMSKTANSSHKNHPLANFNT
jgi:hypothetical protein